MFQKKFFYRNENCKINVARAGVQHLDTPKNS